MKLPVKTMALVLGLALATTGCFRGGGRLFGAMVGTAIITAAIVSAQPPPRPMVVRAPHPRPGYIWQPGYWVWQDEEWMWVEGWWISEYPGYVWEPTHWVRDPSGNWRLISGRWILVEPPPPPPPPRPRSAQ
jgi:hypothetical protein